VFESAFGRGGIGRGRGRGGHPMNSAQNGFVGIDYSPYKFYQRSGGWPSKESKWKEDEDENERSSGDLKDADKWMEPSLKFDGIYLNSNGHLLFVINEDADGKQKRVLSYEEAMYTDMRGVCKFLSAKMQQKLAVQQL
uniref:Beta-amylase n=1 Tax=Globodera pallida TaxID=36090 RepID=A0A183CPM5_GLOPA